MKERVYLSPHYMGGGDKVLPMIGSKRMPTGTRVFSDPQESKPEATHYVHLADGRILQVRHDGVYGDVHTDKDGTRTLVIGVYPKDV